MNNKKRLSIYMNRVETAWGWVYMPFFLFLLSDLLGLVCELLGLNTNSAQGKAYLNGAFFAVNFLAAVVIFHDFLKKSFSKIGKSFWGFVQAVILGMVMYYVGNLLVNSLVMALMPEFVNVNNQSIQSMAAASGWIMLVGTVFLVPLTEECLTRGLIFQGLFRRSRIAAYILSTLFFALIHMAGYVGSYPWPTLLLGTVQYIPAGIALAWAYEKADTIFAPITMHCLINAMAYGLMA